MTEAFEAAYASIHPLTTTKETAWRCWQEAVRLEREAIAATFDNITQIRKFGVEIAAEIRARSEVIDDSASPIN